MLDHPIDPGDALRREALSDLRARLAGLIKLRSELSDNPCAVAELTRRIKAARGVERLFMRRMGAAAGAVVTRRTYRIAVGGAR